MTNIPKSYGITNPLQDNFPPPIIAQRAPLATDTAYPIGQVWVRETTNQSWILTSIVAGVATYALQSPGASDVDTLTGDAGGAISPAGGNITLAGGTNVGTVGAVNTITFNLNPAITLATSVTSPIYTSAAAMAINAPAANNITMRMGDAIGANLVRFTDSANALVASINSDGVGTFVSMDGILGAVAPAAATVTTGTANTSFISPLYTSAAANVLLRPGGANDVIARLGDAAGATFFRVQSSTPADVFTISSTGVFGAILGITCTGAFTQTAGAVNIGMDNLGSAINIGGGNVVKALAIGGGAAAHTLALGSAAAGAGSWDSAAGISLDAATASNFTVTGATQDLTLQSVGGSININATESIADAIIINASGVASSMNIDCGTTGLTVDTTGAFSIDGAAASNITVTSAGLDLSIQGVGCAVNLTSTQNENDCIVIEASDVVGGIQIRAGSGGITIGNEADTAVMSMGLAAPTVNRTISIGAGTVVTAAVTDTLNIGTGGATTNANSIKVVNLNTGGVAIGEVNTNIATGAVTSGTHTTSIATGARAAGTMALNMMTGTGTKIANLGNADALTTFNIDAITLINDSVNAQTNINTGTSTGAVVIGNALGGAVTIDSVGLVELNSAGAAISIGNDANNFAANFGTAGVRTVTVGSVTGASSTVLQAGTAGFTITGTINDSTSKFETVTGDRITFRASPIAQSILPSCVIPTGVAATTDLLAFENGIIMEQFIIGTQTLLAPRMGAAALGLTVSCDLTNAEGKEYNFGADRTSSKHSFTIGTSPAFYMQMRFTCQDVSSLEPAYFGFRQTEANNAAYTAYNEFCLYGVNDGVAPGDCAISTRKAAGVQVNTDTNDAWADTTTHTLRINVSAAGVVTFLFDGAPPTATQAFTFTNAIVVHPCWTHLFNATVGAGDEIYWISMEVGFQ